MILGQIASLISTACLLGLVSDLCSEEPRIIAEDENGFSKFVDYKTLHSRRSKTCPSCDLSRSKANHQRRSSQAYIESKFPDSNETQIIDLMVIYESSVINLAGGTDKLKTVISKAVEDTNKCFSNSLIPLRVRLVHSREVFYSLVNYHKDLNRLSIPNDGYMDTIYTYRDQYGADLVCMLSSIVGDTGGLGDTLLNTATKMSKEDIYKFGFNINLWSELGAPEYTLAHEIGHALGCVHNRESEVGNSDMLFPFAFGKRWFAAGQGVRSVMAYDNDNVDIYPMTVPYFSNPAVSYLSEPTGNINSEDNAQVIRRTSSFISSLRSTKVQGIHPSQFELNLEEGVIQKISLKLMMEPNDSQEVSISLTGTNNISTISSSFVSFDASNWQVPQEVRLLGTNVDKNHTAQLIFSLTGVDSNINIPINILTSSKSGPTGWIWLEKFPWAYAHEERLALFFFWHRKMDEL